MLQALGKLEQRVCHQAGLGVGAIRPAMTFANGPLLEERVLGCCGPNQAGLYYPRWGRLAQGKGGPRSDDLATHDSGEWQEDGES